MCTVDVHVHAKHRTVFCYGDVCVLTAHPAKFADVLTRAGVPRHSFSLPLVERLHTLPHRFKWLRAPHGPHTAAEKRTAWVCAIKEAVERARRTDIPLRPLVCALVVDEHRLSALAYEPANLLCKRTAGSGLGALGVSKGRGTLTTDYRLLATYNLQLTTCYLLLAIY